MKGESSRRWTGMDITSELRYPTKWYSKLVVAVIAISFFALLSSTAVSIFLLYRILSPTRSEVEISQTDFPGRPEEFSFSVPGESGHAGWFFPGFKGAATIILCHGYGSSRGELLTLATSLQDRQYNVFMFDFAAHGTNTERSTMGFVEAVELGAAVNALSRRDDVNPHVFGIWGTNLGAYAALAVAERNKLVRALILESVYDRPSDFVKLQVQRTELTRIPLVQDMTVRAFDWEYRKYKQVPPLSANLDHTAGVYKLFLEAPDEPELAEATRELFVKAPGPKQNAVLQQGNYAEMSDEAKRSYENRILSFFLLNMPANQP
jgi:pimeloyl-ACP methyl ester carboxylesterase